MFRENFLGSSADVAMVAQGRRERVWFFARDGGDRAQNHGEPDGEDALFTPGKDAAAEIEGSERGVVGSGR